MENSTVQSNPSSWPVALKFGLMGGMAYIFINLIQYLLGMMDIEKIAENIGTFNLGDTLMSWGFWIFAIGVFTLIYWLAIKARREELGGFITFGQGFKVSFFSVLVKALVVLLWSLLFHYVINPSFSEGMFEIMSEVMMQSSGGDENAMEMIMTMSSYMYSPMGMSLIVVFSTIAGGLLLSLLAAAIGQKG
jgi:hypothetical protein